MKLSDRNLPFFHRLERNLGRLFGRHWVDEDEVAVVYENGQLHLPLHRGPGFFNIDPFTQEVRLRIKAAPDAFRASFRGIQTRDGLPVDFELVLIFNFIPERASRELTHLVVQWTPDERRALLYDRARIALQHVLAELDVDEVCRGAIVQRIEERTFTRLQQIVNGLGIEPTRIYLFSLTPPPELRARYAEIVRRRTDAHDLAQYTPNELSRVTQARLVEALSRMSPSRQYIEFPANPMDVAPTSSPPVIDASPVPPPNVPNDSLSADRTDQADDDDRPSPPRKRLPSQLLP